MMIAVLLALALQVPPVASQVMNAVSWDLDVADQVSGPVTLFLVCLDGQPTAVCATVLETTGVVTAPGVKTYTWKLPAITPGDHKFVVQSCTAGAAECSAGVSLAFTFQPVLVNPKNVRLTKAGG